MKYTHVEESMKKHYQKSHAWAAKDGIKWRKQSFQSFFRGPDVRHGYFIITTPS